LLRIDSLSLKPFRLKNWVIVQKLYGPSFPNPQGSQGLSRRVVLQAGVGLLGALSLAACEKPEEPLIDSVYEDEPFEYIDPKLAKQVGTLEWAASGIWRSKHDKARDKYRHPLQLLRF